MLMRTLGALPVLGLNHKNKDSTYAKPTQENVASSGDTMRSGDRMRDPQRFTRIPDGRKTIT